ncbi:hypothetical protein DAPPUDRAFT_308284 [Daphnia pulex]|uniref:Rad21/Rec8-like protein N-terminal domain-containing protein n=1 Tax=Daphnia pulex TaxID=6669 RepID=E9H6Y6_DAPPU|nr:hypothetical protein DAPPUDRAFT_308284 [Daphnia pulex]|eukprot:EFX72483.1 hypothetical protein DAPPUDRAFT_308284 [Daphnia pulex]
MFYDIDILNRRGGKFGIIWLAANKKLRLKGKGSKNDLRLLLQVRVDRICQEIVRYVKTVNPAGTEGSSPRFSLYLSAMLTHGAIIAHHKQVSHTLDLSDAVIGAGKYLLSDGCSLEDSEFGRLVAVVDALKIPSIYPIANETRQAPLCEVQLNCPASPGEIERLFAEMEVPSGFHEFNMNSSGIYVSPSEITIKETDEPLLTIADLPPIDDRFFGNDKFEDAFGTLEVLSSWNESNFEQIQQVPGPSNLRRSNSKRVIHDDCSAAEDVPNKQSRTEPAGEEAPTATTAMQFPDPRGGERRRRRRLIIDEEIIIPTELFRAQLYNCGDLLRTPNEDVVRTEYTECTVHHIFRRPSVETYQNPLVRQLITRNLVTVKDQTERNGVLNEINLEPAQMNVNVPNHPEDFPMAVVEPIIPEDVTMIVDEPNPEDVPMIVDEPNPEDVPMIVVEPDHEAAPAIVFDEPERARNLQPNENSIAGSVNLSNLTVGNVSGYASPRQAEKHLPNMQSIKEVASESTASTQHTGEKTNVGDLPPVGVSSARGNVGAFSPVNNQPSLSTSQRNDTFSEVKVPEPQALLDTIDEMSDQVSRLTFRQLVPPTKYSKLEAAKIFQTLLGLAKDRKISMKQDTNKPFSDIFITLDR